MMTDFENYESVLTCLLDAIKSRGGAAIDKPEYSISSLASSMQQIFDAFDFIEQNRALVDSNIVEEYELIKDLLLHFEDRLIDICTQVSEALEQRGAADGR